MITAWRLVHKRKVDEAFTGTGSKRYGGRWNHKGVGVVYVSDSLALAALEIIVHASFYQALKDYVSIKVLFPKTLVIDVTDIGSLPKDWRADPPPAGMKEIGKKWYTGQATAVLKVPSAIIPNESNYILNPRHPDFKKITIDQPAPFEFDQRLNLLSHRETRLK